MKNRTSIAPWLTLPDGRHSLAWAPPTMSVDPVGEEFETVRLSETWRGWEAGTSSEFLNWFLFNAEAAVLEDWIWFREDRSELDPRAIAILSDRLKLFQADPAMRIVIGGLAFRPGTIADGMGLGLRRVLSIQSFLLAAGIDPGRIGVAVRGSGWSVAERCGSADSAHQGSECRLQVTDAHWTLARN